MAVHEMTRRVSMIKKRLLSLAMACTLVVTSIAVGTKKVSADNPIVQTYYTADPSPLVVGDTMYLITSHDEDVIEKDFYTMKNWKCYSTKDMVNWTDHGTIFGQTSFEWGHTTDFRAWASQAVERDGRYYLYVPILRKGAKETDGSPGYGIGVAVADTPYGPYEDAIGKPLIEGDWYDIDPTVFIDDDGQAYLFYGQTLKYCLLNDDMVSLKTKPTKFSVPNYVEGPWFTKHDNRYYFMWAASGGAVSSDHKGGENIQYAYCDEPLGDYTYGGILQETTKGMITANGNISGSFTNHPGVADFKGHSYLFYHTNELPGGGSYHRSVGVAEFKYNDDGTIDLVDMPDSIEPIGVLSPYQKTEAETICYEKGIKTGWANGTPITNAENLFVYNMHNEDYITVRNVDFGNEGAEKFTASVKDVKGDANASIEIYIDDDEKIGTLRVDNQTGEWKEITTTLDKKITGVHDLKFVFSGDYDKPENENLPDYDGKSTVSAEDTGMFKFDYWKFEEVIKPTPTPDNKPQPTVTPSVTVTAQPTLQPEEKVEAPARPKISSKKLTKGKAKFTWKKVSRAKGYQVLYSTSGTFKKALKKVSTKKTTVTIKKLKKGKNYYVKVAAYVIDKQGDRVYSKYSPTVKVKAR